MKTLPGKFFLAPMAEISTPALRQLVKEFNGSVVLFSEMLSAGAIAAQASHNAPLVRLRGFDDPIVYQLVGSDPAVMARAASLLSRENCAGIDINMGCFNYEIVKKGQGARLLGDIDSARAIVRACRAAARGTLSVKMRCGYENGDEDAFAAFVKMIEEEGADFITVHGRTARMAFRRAADWRYVALAKQSVSIPVIGNGDINSPEICAQRISADVCDGVMIGRAAVREPWIFRLCGEGIPGPFQVNTKEVFLKALELIARYLPVNLHKSRIDRFCFYYSKNLRFGHGLFNAIRRSGDISSVMAVISDYYSRNSSEEIKYCQNCN